MRLGFHARAIDASRDLTIEGLALLGRLGALPYFPVPSKTAEKVRRTMLRSSVAEAWRA